LIRKLHVDKKRATLPKITATVSHRAKSPRGLVGQTTVIVLKGTSPPKLTHPLSFPGRFFILRGTLAKTKPIFFEKSRSNIMSELEDSMGVFTRKTP